MIVQIYIDEDKIPFIINYIYCKFDLILTEHRC